MNFFSQLIVSLWGKKGSLSPTLSQGEGDVLSVMF